MIILQLLSHLIFVNKFIVLFVLSNVIQKLKCHEVDYTADKWKIQILTRCLLTERKYASLGTNPNSRIGEKAHKPLMMQLMSKS